LAASRWTGPCAHPNRLIVYRPTQAVLVAGFLDEIGSHARFGRARSHPPRWPHAEVLGESFCRFRNDPRLIVLLQVAEPFGIAAAVVAHFVTALLDALNYIRIVLTDKAVEQDRRR